MTADTEDKKQAGNDVADLKTAVTATVTKGDKQAPTTDERALQAERIQYVTLADLSHLTDYPQWLGMKHASLIKFITNIASQSQQERLDLQHHLFTLTLGGKLSPSPIGDTKHLSRVLDAGTGTGVIGIDLSLIQPNFIPTNLQFQVDDLQDEWTFTYPFNFIFARMITGSIGDFPKFFAQSFNALSPGGWVECQDITFPPQCDDGTLRKDSYIDQWSSLMIEAMNKFDRTAESAKFYEQQMIDVGFVKVAGVMWLGWSPEEVEVFLAKVSTDTKDRRIHAWWPIHVVYGQKPKA
ncbi:methyltransferase [Fusarium coicis]|nr:methyltransferase [Fusarium coicis]